MPVGGVKEKQIKARRVGRRGGDGTGFLEKLGEGPGVPLFLKKKKAFDPPWFLTAGFLNVGTLVYFSQLFCIFSKCFGSQADFSQIKWQVACDSVPPAR